METDERLHDVAPGPRPDSTWTFLQASNDSEPVTVVNLERFKASVMQSAKEALKRSEAQGF